MYLMKVIQETHCVQAPTENVEFISITDSDKKKIASGLNKIKVVSIHANPTDLRSSLPNF